jgi:hypothetical protein
VQAILRPSLRQGFGWQAGYEVQALLVFNQKTLLKEAEFGF